MGLIRNAGYAEAAVPGVSHNRGDGHDRGMARSLTPHFTTTASFPGLYVDVHLFVAGTVALAGCGGLLYIESNMLLPELFRAAFYAMRFP
ncbi:hypothetical protein [Terracidiphilus gabretensis]|uniref:hypothetical protein n=1 Tax=Terracidiphilus gabretensis TaxID=1577687 RepID=UPI0018D25817|nr:hypothetical protein [Terracidiphilus gabretensis]